MSSAARRLTRQGAGRPSARPWTWIEGVPVYDATVVQSGDVDMGAGRGLDGRVLLGIGPAEERPVAYTVLCPCQGVDGLVVDLTTAATDAKARHEAHDERYTHRTLMDGWPGPSVRVGGLPRA